MLSNQTLTNVTGYHRRQRSTPTLSALTEPFQLSPAERFDSRADSTNLRHLPKGPSYHPSVEHQKPQQDQYQFQQATQQTITRPGHLYAADSIQPSQYDRDQSPSSGHIHHDEYLSTEAINALLMDLQTNPAVTKNEIVSGDLEGFHAFHQSRGSDEPISASNSRPPSRRDGKHRDFMVDQHQNADGANMHTTMRRKHMSLDLTNATYITDMHALHNVQTPVQHQESGHTPKTPMTAPMPDRQHGRYNSCHDILGMSPTKDDPDSTIKASHAMQRGRSCQDSFAMMRANTESFQSANASRAAPLMRRSADCAIIPSPDIPSMSDLALDKQFGSEGCDTGFYSSAASSAIESFHTSPATPTVSLFASQNVDASVLNATDSWVQTMQRHDMPECRPPSTPQMSPHQRAQSVTETDLEECIVPTGVTADEIAAFIQGPFPDDSKWRCLYKEKDGEECGKRFARKENAKSHVQTHLGDRQYSCKVCHVRFVRQHDLKRHLKTHTTEKPYKCPCGKDFHRHDALTRHRQRGMCIGAFESSPKKSVKRGRPKKPRPSSEERAEKAAQTRQRIMEKIQPGSTYASSISGSSEDSHGSPPCFDSLSVSTSSPSLSHKDLRDLNPSNPTYSALTPPTSPMRSPDKSYSSPYSQHSYTPMPVSRSPSPKITSIPEEANDFSMQALELNNDDYQSSLPELELSSSSPATSHFNFVSQSDIRRPELSISQLVDFMNPQFQNGDFQLYDVVSAKGSQDSATFDDFFDFGSYEDPSAEKNDSKRVADNAAVRHEFLGPSLVKELDDPFVEI